MSKKNELSKKDAQKWANALRSGAYPQTKGTLEDAGGYCCLGVACDIFIPPSKQTRGQQGYLMGGVPDTCQNNAPDWLMDVNCEFDELTSRALSALNDEGYTFDEIADVIELVYVHKAL